MDEIREPMITNEAVNHAIDYILQHTEEDVTLEDVADHCHFSKYYFSRLFKKQTGESIYAFIKRVRLEQSAFSQHYQCPAQYRAGRSVCSKTPSGNRGDRICLPFIGSGFPIMSLLLLFEKVTNISFWKISFFMGNLCAGNLKRKFGIYRGNLHRNYHVCL